MSQTLSKRPENYSSSSVLISILYLVGIVDWSSNCIKHRHRGRPFVYYTTIILHSFIVRIWFRLDSNRSLHHVLSLDLPYNRKVMKACELSVFYLSSRRTFDRWLKLKTFSTDIKRRRKITTMGNLFVFEGLAKPYIVAIDSTLLKSKGHVWHTSMMIEEVIPYSGIDTDARWGFSHTKGWIFGYNLHLVCN